MSCVYGLQKALFPFFKKELGMFGKFSEAFSLFWDHLGLFAAVVLTVWLPGNIGLNCYIYYVKGVSDSNVMRWSGIIDGLLSPIYIGAIIYALYYIKMGTPVTYREAISIGFQSWGMLFAARLCAGILIFLGLVALIIPGIILAVRYSLLEQTVILECLGHEEARARSVELTSGRRWRIFAAAILFFLSYLVLSLASYWGFDLFFTTIMPENITDFFKWGMMSVNIGMDCALNIYFAISWIVLFLFYWEATHEDSPELITQETLPVGVDDVLDVTHRAP